MKLHLPSSLRAALVAAILSVTSYTLSSAHATGVAENKEELTLPTPTLDGLYGSGKSAYQLEEVELPDNPAEDISIIKYHFNPSDSSYTPVEYNVVFNNPLGDIAPDENSYIYYRWQQDADTKAWKLQYSSESDADIIAYSIHNVREEGGVSAAAIKHSFIDLYSERDGGAIYNLLEMRIGNVTGDFIANLAFGSGGAIYNEGTMSAIMGHFISNSSKLNSGGAISNSGTMGAITGDFIANSASSKGGAILNEVMIEALTGDFIANSAYDSGGAIHNNGTIRAITGDFIANSARRGGAILNAGSIGFLAKDSSIQFTGNFFSEDGGVTKTYEAIYNGPTSGFGRTASNNVASLHFNAYGEHSITVNDRINGQDYNKDNQIIHINNGIDGAGDDISADGLTYGTVIFNDNILNQSITVHAGTLKLGKIESSDSEQGIVPTSAQEGNYYTDLGTGTLKDSDLTVKAGATVIAHAADYLGEGNTIMNDGKLTLGTGTLSSSILGSGDIILNGVITSNEALNADSLTFDYSGGNHSQLIFRNAGVLNVSGGIIVNVSNSYTTATDFIQWENYFSVENISEIINNITITGVTHAFTTLTQTGNSYSLTIIDLGTYDPDAGYVFSSVTVDNPKGSFSLDVPTYDSETDTYSLKPNNLTFTGTLGDDFSNSASDGVNKAAKSYNWEIVNGRYTLIESQGVTESDLVAYSSNNVRVTADLSGAAINHSFLGLDGVYSGGAIHNAYDMSIGDVTGDFIANSATQSGGAIRNEGTMGAITGHFIGNSTINEGGVILSEGGAILSEGGAIFNTGTIAAIEGDFISNSAYTSGGAIHNTGTIRTITGDFIANSARQGGAILNAGSIGFLAKDSSIQFTGNFFSEDGGVTKTYEAIYNGSTSGFGRTASNNAASLHFNAYGEHSITVNDRINGKDYNKDNQIIHINNGIDGAGDDISADGLTYGTVIFNDNILNQSITVHAGTLKLGKIEGRDNEQGIVPTSAQEGNYYTDLGTGTLKDSDLTVKAGATVIAHAADYLGEGNTIMNDGKLTLGTGTLSSSILGSGDIILNGVITSNETLYADTLTFDYSGGNHSQLIFRNAGVLNVSGGIIVNVSNSYTTATDFIQWENYFSVENISEIINNITITGVTHAFTTLTQTGNSYSLTIIDLGTYDPDAGYVFSSVTVDNPKGSFSLDVPTYDSETDTYSLKPNNLTFTGTLGDDFSNSASDGANKATKSYNWEIVNGRYTLIESQGVTEPDLVAYSSNNVRVTADLSGAAINHSFLGLDGVYSGGAIHNAYDMSIGDVSGDFIANSATQSGGAIRNEGTMGAITGHFIANSANSKGGAILNDVTMGTLTGDFIANSAYDSGGAIHNTGTIRAITGDFIANSARRGGAIFNTGSIGFLAKDSSIQFTGNFFSEDDGVTKTYEAIYNSSTSGFGRTASNNAASLHFNAYGEHSITVNDRINGEDYNKDNQIIHINNGIDGAGDDISADGLAYGTVIFNDNIFNQSITVHAGELRLGKLAGSGKEGEEGYIPAREAALHDSSLTIKAGALVSVQGQLVLDEASSISTSTESASGKSTIRGLTSDSSISGGHITLADNGNLSIENIALENIDIRSEANTRLSLKSVTMGENSTLHATHLTLSFDSDNVAASSTMSLTGVATPLNYTLSGIDMGMGASVSGTLTLNVNMKDSDFDAFNTAYENGESVVFTIAGLEGAELPNGLAYASVNGQRYYAEAIGDTAGAIQFSIIPEPSTATLSLLALAGLLARRRRKAVAA